MGEKVANMAGYCSSVRPYFHEQQASETTGQYLAILPSVFTYSKHNGCAPATRPCLTGRLSNICTHSLFGVSLSEPHTSMTSLRTHISMLAWAYHLLKVLDKHV